jgi:hypothetical protein
VIGEHDERETGLGGGLGDLVGAAAPVRSVRVDVNDAGERPVAGQRLEMETGRWKRQCREETEGRDEDCAGNKKALQGILAVRRYNRASARSAAALSVRSQVNSGSERPKCPNAAVFL